MIAIEYIDLAKAEKELHGQSGLFWHILANRRRVLLKEMKAFAERKRLEPHANGSSHIVPC